MKIPCVYRACKDFDEKYSYHIWDFEKIFIKNNKKPLMTDFIINGFLLPSAAY